MGALRRKVRDQRPRRLVLDVEERDLAPFCANWPTISAPMPEAPPVISTTRPARLG